MKKILLLGFIVFPSILFSQCFISFFSANVGACDPNDGNFNLTGEIQFINAPATGQLIVADCNGNQSSYNAPFTSPFLYSILDIPADGNSCSVTAFFTADPGCTSTAPSYNNPPPCGSCSADIGTFTNNITGSSTASNPWYLCFNDVLSINSNGDNTPPDDVSAQMPTVNYDPGMWLLAYGCAPTIGPPNDLIPDTCLLGIADQANGNWNIINSTGDGSTAWYVPVTMYSMSDGIYATSINNGPWCYDLGPTYEVVFLEEIVTNEIIDGTNGTITVTVSGGLPAYNGSSFDISVISPATAVLSQTTVESDSTFVVSNLQNGQVYQFVLTDGAGCSVTIGAPDPFVGMGELVSQKIQIYPNPSSGKFTVVSNQEGELTIRDITGRYIRSGRTNEDIDLSGQPSGIYLIYVLDRVYRICIDKVG